MMNHMEMIEKRAVYWKSLFNKVEKYLFCISQGSEVRVCRRGGHIYIFLMLCYFRMMFTKNY